MADWVIDGTMEAQDAGVFNKMRNAKTEFHYKLLKSEHKGDYDAQYLEFLNECTTVAKVGWLRSLVDQRCWCCACSPT